MNKCNLSPMALGMSLGVVWGVSVFITGLLAYYMSYGKPFVLAMSSVYIGYDPSIVGSFIGGAFGFIDGFIGGLIIGALYNYFVKCCSCCVKSCGTMEEKPAAKKAKKA